ncbi:MAG: hypothetical protein ACLQVY_17235 [Limisphaerales bacterium]
MTPKLKHWLFDNHLIISFVLLVGVLAASASIHAMQSPSFLCPIVGTVLGLSYFALKQHLEEVHLFKELFSEFNARYDKMSKQLYALLARPDPKLTGEEITLLYGYFNLCAEEYLYYRKGFIYTEVWRAWLNGMVIFYEDPRICSLWKKELQTSSYYGFTTAQLHYAADHLQPPASMASTNLRHHDQRAD